MAVEFDLKGLTEYLEDGIIEHDVTIDSLVNERPEDRIGSKQYHEIQLACARARRNELRRVLEKIKRMINEGYR